MVNWGLGSAQIENFIELKISGTPKLCWVDQVKSEFQSHFKVQKGHKHTIALFFGAFLAIFVESKSIWNSFRTIPFLWKSLPQVIKLSLFLFKRSKKDVPCPPPVIKLPRGYLGRKVVHKNILGTWCGTCEGLGVRGIRKVVGKMALAHQVLSSLEAP